MDESFIISVYRCRLEFPMLNVKAYPNETLAEFLKKVVSLVEKESTEFNYYRFRRIGVRKNETRRPMEIYEEEQMKMKLYILKLNYRLNIYLEQDTDSHFHELGMNLQGTTLISVAKWEPILQKPISIGNYAVPSSTTIMDLKKLLSTKTHILVQDMILIEEENPERFNILDKDHWKLSEYGIVYGDFIHVEKVDKEILSQCPDVAFLSFTQQYYLQKKIENDNKSKMELIKKEIDEKYTQGKTEMIIKECNICFINQANSVFIPCGHLVMII